MELPGLQQGAEPLSVGQLTAAVQTTLEGRFSRVTVRGEISNFKAHGSGHWYFSLKDDAAQLRSVAFRGVASRLNLQLTDGMQVVATGRISVYPPQGSYQLVVDSLSLDGVGQLQQRFEALKKKLAAEGLFEAERKQALPILPKHLAVITSPTGAAVQDFLRILKRRGFKGRATVYPARVQGSGAAKEIAAAIAAANQHSSAAVAAGRAPLSCIVVTRGGGSLEDLWAFNEEVVVRAIAASNLPVISAVGHEIDTTLADFAADVRAETPSGAAELLSSLYLHCLQGAQLLGSRLQRATLAQFKEYGWGVQHAAQQLAAQHPRRLLEMHAMRTDDLAHRFKQRTAALLQRAQAQVAAAGPRLEAVGLQRTLARGFAAIQTEGGAPITTATALQKALAPAAATAHVVLQGGSVPVQGVEGAGQGGVSAIQAMPEANNKSKPRKRSKKPEHPGQAELF